MRKSVLRVLLIGGLAGALILAYAAVPRRADLRAFDPAGMARLDTAMWRDYHDKVQLRAGYRASASVRD